MIQFTVRAGHKTQHVVNNKVHAFALLRKPAAVSGQVFTATTPNKKARRVRAGEK